MNTWRGRYLRLTAMLRQARIRAGVTQERAARRIGRSTRTYMRFEAGEADIQLAHLFALCDLMGIVLDLTVLSPETPAAAAAPAAGSGA